MRKGEWWAILVGPGYAHNAEPGFSLIEILVALGIIAAVAVVFLLGMSTSSKAVMVSQEAVTVESLAKSEMEYVKNCLYDATNNPPIYNIDPNLTIPQDYNISVTAARLNPKGDDPTNDDGLQKITVTVTHAGEPSITVEGYKLKP
jgi:prepilin-type N-terminal cleavage/methylation domain-containing protein